jgi:putative peptide zinc metalloprotease protein
LDNGRRVRLAAGVELIGRRDHSGYRATPYLVRRPDGHMVKFSHLLFLVASSLDGERDLEQVAAHVSTALGREISPSDVAYLIEQRLQPAGLLPDPSVPQITIGPGRRRRGDAHARHHRRRRRPDDLERALRDRMPIVPEHIHGRATELLAPLFERAAVIGVLVLLGVADAWLALTRSGDVAGGFRQVLHQPQWVLLLGVLAIGAAIVHESGHATAARYGGARPGAMQAGIRRLVPVFATDVSRTDRLTHPGRVRCALGGIYFDALTVLGLTLAFGLTGFRPLLVLVVLVQVECLVQFLPFVRLDGYYLMSHLARAPRLYDHLQPALVRLVRHGNRPDERNVGDELDELSEPARRLVTLWLAATGIVLAAGSLALLVLLPRLAGAAVGSATAQVDAIAGPGGLVLGRRLWGVVGLALLAIPAAGLAYVAGRSVGRARRALGAWWKQRPGLTATAIVTAAVIMLLQVGIFWPERFTAAFQRAQSADEVTRVTSGRGPLEVAAGSLPFPARTSDDTEGVVSSAAAVITDTTTLTPPSTDEVAQADDEDAGGASPWEQDGSATAANAAGSGDEWGMSSTAIGSGASASAEPAGGTTAVRSDEGVRWPSADAVPAGALPANGATQSPAPGVPRPPLSAAGSPAGTTFSAHATAQAAPAPAPTTTASTSAPSPASAPGGAPAEQQAGATADNDPGGIPGLLTDLLTTLLVPGG